MYDRILFLKTVPSGRTDYLSVYKLNGKFTDATVFVYIYAKFLIHIPHGIYMLNMYKPMR